MTYRDQLMQLIANSNRSYDEIVAFLKGTDDDQDAEE